MGNGTSGLTCGNCGIAVDEAVTICPSCGALLAAYQAPAGSDAASDAVTRPVFEPNPAVPADSVISTPVTGPVPISEPIKPVTSPHFSADQAIADARQTLGMPSSGNHAESPVRPVVEERSQPTPAHHKATSSPATNVPGSSVPRSSARSNSPETPASTKRESRATATGSRPTRPAPSDRGQRQAPASSSEQSKANAPTTQLPLEDQRVPATSSQAGRTFPQIMIVSVMVLIFLIVIGRSFAGSIFFPLMVFGLIWWLATVAKKTGRKTSNMPRMDRHDPWNS